MSINRESFIQGYPVKVIFAGFESDTLKLQEQGWQISLHERRDMWCGFFLSLYHEQANLRAMTNIIEERAFNYITRMDRMHIHSPGGRLTDLVFHVQSVYPRIECMRTPIPEAFTSTPVDCRPQITEIQNLDEFALFRPINPEAEFFLDKYDAMDLMKIVLEKQKPKQKELREKKRKKAREKAREGEFSGYDSAKDIQLQIVSV